MQWALVQHVADLRRREPRNIGVLVECEAGRACRFKGVRPDGRIDGRVAPALGGENHYGRWVRYWRWAFEEEQLSFSEIMATGANSHFVVISGGQQFGGPDDGSAGEIAEALFEVLVDSSSHDADES